MRALVIALALIASPALAQEMDYSHHGAMASPSVETVDAEVGNAPPPPVPSDHAADRIYPVDRMARAREELVAESRFSTFTVMADLFELRTSGGKDGYA